MSCEVKGDRIVCKTTNRQPKQHEMKCSQCGGAGLLHCADETTWNVEVCKYCNGLGVVAVLGKKTVAYQPVVNLEVNKHGNV